MRNIFLGSKIIDSDMKKLFHRKVDWKKFYGKTFFISGSTGMLASYIIYFLIYLNEFYNAHIRIIAQARSIEKCQERFDKYTESGFLRICLSSILRPIAVDEKIDYIIHAASFASPQYYTPMPVEVAAPNVLGTYNLLRLAKEKQVKGFLFFSSCDVYGEIRESNDVKEDMMGIMDPLALHSCYGESKRMGENFCVSFAREYDVPAKIVRICHTYGPNMDIYDDPRVFASFMKCIFEGRDIVMLSEGTAKRAFCYIVDAISAFFLILLKGKSGEAYNVANTSEFLSIESLAGILVSLRPELNLKVVKMLRDPNDSYIENTINKDNKINSDKLYALGWRPCFTTIDGFKNVFDYLIERRNGSSKRQYIKICLL